MKSNANAYGHRLLAFLLAVIFVFGTLLSHSVSVYAADGTLTFNSGEKIAYGSYFTTRMTFDGSNTAYCVEPLKATPAAGTYDYDLLSKDSPIRKALFYLPGGYGYDKSTKNQYFGGWADDDAYVIGHLTVAYIYADYDAGSGAFHGAPQSFIDKTLEVTNAINSLPAPPDSFKAFLVPGSGSQTITGSWYKVPNGFIEIQKSSSNAPVSDGNSNYSLSGAKYGIYLGDKLMDTLTTDENGYAKSKELEADQTYTVRETDPSKGFALDTNSYNVTVESEQTASQQVPETPQNNPVDLALQKLDAELKTSTPQGGSSLADAEFTVKFYDTQSDRDPAESGSAPLRTWVLKTDANGELHFNQASLVSGDEFYYQNDKKTVCFPLGTVTLLETKAPAGYHVNDTVFVQKITGSGNQETIQVYQASTVEDFVYRGGVSIQKRDLETGKDTPQGSASFQDAVFTITTLSDNPVLVDGQTFTQNQVVATIKTNKTGLASTKADTLPYGHYRIDEEKSPEGYLNEGKISVEFDITEPDKIVELTSEEHAILNQPIRGDLEFVKISDGDHNRLADVPFTITSKTTGESHTLVTDKNGYASTSSEWNKHSANTNKGESSKDGIWFGESKPDDTKGALLYDTYVIEEQRCKTNEGMNLINFEVTIYKNSVTVDLGTLTDDQIVIATTALDSETDSHMSQVAESVTIVDTVEYEGLKKGTEYKLVGTLMDAESGEALLIDEKPVTSEVTFTAKKSTGSAKVKFTFNATGLKGKTLVVFEDLYQNDLKLTSHADLKDTDQTIYFPEIGTTAKDSDTGNNLSCADKEVTLIDTMSYKGLVPGESYKVITTLMDKETGKPLEIDGKVLTEETKFTPKDSEGTTEISMTFDGATLKGKTIVFFESVTYKDKEVAVHADLESEPQTIYFPEIATTASDTQTGTNQGIASSEVTIKDQVDYKTLIPGKDYVLTGTLMLKDTEKALEIDGKPVTSTLTFTPEKPSGSVELSFTFDGAALKGQATVVFESLTTEEKQVAVHADLSDDKQSVYFPEIGTTAKDGDDGDQEALADTKVTIIDTVTYKHLIPGGNYKLTGVLMDKETGKAIELDGKQVTAETTFTPEKTDGSAEVSFTFDGTSLSGHDLVVFEKLFYVTDKKELEIAAHEDIQDKGQTIHLTDTPKETSSGSTPSSPVKTGDDSNQLLYILLAATSGILLIGAGSYFIYKRRKRNSDNQ
ncbi:MAG: VaFE repeat-containing surface-anchored protein [Hespellia sp.]|nr:VaFE repeat-containing surface-anchored protein [Hespellia sp.]